MIQKRFKVTAENGLHARPATILVNVAVKYKSEIKLEHEAKEVNLKSIMGVMSLGVYSGEVVTVTVEGADEENAMSGITDSFYELRLGKEI